MSIVIFVPDFPELKPLLSAAESTQDCTVKPPKYGYWTIEAERVLELKRKELGLGPALWNSALAGGFCGKIVEYDRDTLRIECETQ